MKILHLTSDWKWTGPAEPMLLAGEALRSLGHQVELACPVGPDGEYGVFEAAAARGVVPSLVLERDRGIRPWRDSPDAIRLYRYLERTAFDIVHVWHTRAHGLALRSRAACGALIRSHSSGLVPRLGERWLFGPGCDVLVCTSEACAASHSRRAYGITGAVDLTRFRPASGPSEIARSRALLGVPADASVVGVVARVQSGRRFDVLLDAMVPLCADDPRRRLVVLGRGTRLAEIAREPAAERGLAQQVVFPGYLEGEDYAAALRGLDLLCFLVPGSDGGCRALLEAAASGLPAVVSQRRGLAEWVVDGETGLVSEETPTALAAALARLLESPSERARMGAAARVRAETHFSRTRLAADLERVYLTAGSSRRRN